MIKVVVAEVAPSPERNLDLECGILGDDVALIHYTHDGVEDDLIAACHDADVILTDYAPLDRSVLEQLKQCRLVSVAATGYNSVDTTAAADLGIRVCAVDEYCTDEVADHTLLLILALSRRLIEYHDQVQNQQRWEFDSLSGISRLSGQILGLVGFGRIGQAVAKRASCFGLSIIAHDPYADAASAASQDVDLCQLDHLLTEADIISLHCALTEENEHLLNETAFMEMRKKPILINCARGGLVDESALIKALDTGQVSAAGLDVLNDEAPDLDTSPFLNRDNVILTPHVAFYSEASILENREVSASNIRNFLDEHHEEVRRYIV